MAFKRDLGAGWDANRTRYSQSTQLGYLAPDRSAVLVDAFADGLTGGTVDGAQFDNRVDLSTRDHTASLYVSDTLCFGSELQLTASGRYNRTRVVIVTRSTPVAAPIRSKAITASSVSTRCRA
ncbi:MAG: hypothetical protein RIQ60_366 [Pseudomonadota bacterium]|jgi:outer membrane receptor protein involved in Fe transport